ncbi:MAG: hypothetical protein RL211_852 [Pseudomonadota bacterium]
MTAISTRELGEFVQIRTGKLDANASSKDGAYPFFTCAKEPLRISTFSYDCDCVLVAGNGDLNVKHYKGKFDAYQRTYIVEPLNSSVLNSRFLFHFLDKYVEKLRHLSIGGVIKYIKIGNLTEAPLPVLPIDEQRRIAAILDQAETLRTQRRQALAHLDTLTQSLFLDMFGDPVANPMGWPSCPLAESVEGKYGIKAGPFGSSLKKEDYVTSGFRVYGQEQVIAGRFDIGDYYIDERKFHQLKSCAIQEGDLLVSLVGSFGKVLIVPANVEPGIINPRLLKITLDPMKLTPVFVAQLLGSSQVQRKLASLSHGGTMGILNAGLLKELDVITPPLPLQQTFATRIQAIEALKATHRAALAQLDALFASLQQRAFAGEL